MPYNTAPIPPREQPTGNTELPHKVSRIKKIISVDPDVKTCSNNAAFIICVAAEMFIQHLSKEGLNMAKVERKPRRNIQYQDLANAVAHQENLQFLEDVVPRAVPYKKIKTAAAARRAQLTTARGGPGEGEEAEGDETSSSKRRTNQQKLLLNGNGTFAVSESPLTDTKHSNAEDVEMEE